MDIKDIIRPENRVYKKSDLLYDTTFNFCPGCGHGTIVRLIAEVVQEMGIEHEVIGISPIGCSVLLYDFFRFDVINASHGRAAAAATALKRVMPDRYIFSYQGDGDIAAIGTSETIHTCNRGENITIFFINNAIYGMTGGQMAPTTLTGMKTSTTPGGRLTQESGFPLHFTEMLASLDGTYYATRQAVHTPAAVRKAKKAIRLSLENQKLERGTSVVEFVSNCNSGWRMEPVASNQWMEEHMFPVFPLGDIKCEGKLIQRS
jgi:2-oxoglutarate ferredoxin oxidoreductase subunit beta